MHFRQHGGWCCGIKQIAGFRRLPTDLMSCRDVVAAARDNKYDLAFAAWVSDHEGSLYPKKEPAETYLQKLDRYLGYNDKLFPSGVVEVVLATSVYPHMDQKVWMPVLEERGFELVTSNPNSNSGNTIHIYHRRLVRGKLASLAKKEEQCAL